MPGSKCSRKIFSGCFVGDFFDLHAPFGRDDHDRQAGFAIDDDAQIQLAGDVEALLDVERLDLLAFVARLNRDQRLAQHPLGIVAGLVGRLHQHDAGLLRVLLERPLAAAAGMNLRLHDGDRSLQLREGLGRLIGRSGDDALRDRDAGVGEQLLGLIFVDFHWTERVKSEDFRPRT